ncbi:MAG: cbb3-type cytochrome c oxidase subunit 3 [Alphaproteobacteria bacterium]|nr:cbb3-type cytochrome c oxidase subunit 3 [Alphaproteobacteria bacterium]
MSGHEMVLVVRDHWGIAMMALYIGIVLWAVRPWARGHYQAMASLPLRDEDVAQARDNPVQTSER